MGGIVSWEGQSGSFGPPQLVKESTTLATDQKEWPTETGSAICRLASQSYRRQTYGDAVYHVPGLLKG